MTQPPPYGDPRQYPPQGQYPPPGHGQQPQYPGYVPQYPQDQVGYGPPPQPPRSRTPTIVTIAVIALVVLVGAGVAGVLLLRGGTDSGSPTAAVDGLFRAGLQDRDQEKAKSFVCAAEAATLGNIAGLGALDRTGTDISVTWRNVKELSRSGNEAVVSVDVVVKATLGDQSIDQSMTLKARVVKEDGAWKVCGAAP